MSGAAPAFDFRRLALAAYGPSLLFGLAEGAILPIIPLTVHDLGGTAAVAAAIVMVINIASLLFNVPASVITHRFGERHAIIGASGLGVVGAAVAGLAGTVLALVVGAFLIGISASVFMLARQSYLTEAVPIQFRARALSTLGGVMRVGVFIGPFVGAGAIALWGLRGAFVVFAAAMVLSAVLAATLADLPAHGEPPAGVAGPTTRSVWRDHRQVFLTVGVGILLVSAVRASRQAVVPLWAAHIGLSPQTTSLIYGIAGGVDMLLFYPAGGVMDRLGRRWVTVPSMLIMGVALMAIPLTHTAIGLGVVACLLGFGNGIGSGMVMTLGADYSPDIGRAHFLGIWRELSDLGGTAGPALLAAVTAAAALGTAIVATGVIGFAAAAVLWRSVPPRQDSKLCSAEGNAPEATSAT